jgi:hypothetical protein
MNWIPPGGSRRGGRINALWERGMRLVTRVLIAFALSTTAGIAVGAAVSDNAFVQILVTLLGALAFWIPFFFIILKVDKWLARRRTQRDSRSAEPSTNSGDDIVWRRLFAAAPSESHRLVAIRRSLDRSRECLARAELDPDAHELCILIDRHLPNLINRKLEILPPDDRHRRQKVSELISLIEQFARHCSGRGSDAGSDATFEAEVLRRRFEARLTEF